MSKALEIIAKGTVIPAMPLVLDSSRQFDEKGQRRLLGYYLESGAGGIAAGVHTTQFEIRRPQYNLYRPVLKTVASTIDEYERNTGRVVAKIAGVCGEIPQALAEAELAKSLGYDAILLSPGSLQHLTEEQMLERTRVVAGIIPVMGFYLQPSAGGRILSYDYWRHLAEIDNLIAIKCASFNRYSTLDVMRAVALSTRSDQIAMYTGNDDNIVIDLLTEYKFTMDGVVRTKRFVGGLLGHWAVWTSAAVKMHAMLRAAADSGKITPELLTLAAEVTDANAVLFDASNGFKGCIPGVHEVLRRQGLMSNTLCLNPDETLSPGQSEELDRIYAMYPHLTDDEFVREYFGGGK